jgi:hypothetical protein
MMRDGTLMMVVSKWKENPQSLEHNKRPEARTAHQRTFKSCKTKKFYFTSIPQPPLSPFTS